MHHSVLVDGAWSAPRPLLLFPGQSRAVADDMTVSPDGRELYFLGNHPHPHAAGVRSADIWRSRRINGEWSTAEVVPPPISTEASEVYPLIVGDGACTSHPIARAASGAPASTGRSGAPTGAWRSL